MTKESPTKINSPIKITDIIDNAEKILIIGHMRPDGDCLGAGLSLLHIADRLGKSANFACDSDAPNTYDFMHGFSRLNILNHSAYDTVICVDCGDVARLGRYARLFEKAKYTVNIDHHVTNSGFAKQNLVIPHISSTCQILAKLYLEEGLMDKTAAELLYVGLSTDTGHFQHDNTTQEVYSLAARLLDFGIDSYGIVCNLYRSNSPKKLALIVRAIQSMRLHLDDKICVISLRDKDIKDCGCTLEDTEGIINYAINLRTVEFAACLSQSTTNGYKVSFRSKNRDITPVAMRFGGGGHIHAAGCMLFGAYEDVIDKVERALISELED